MFLISISFIFFKLSGLFFLAAKLARILGNPIDRRASKLVELLKLYKNDVVNSSTKTTRLLLDVQAVLICNYGQPLGKRAIVKTFFHSLIFCMSFSLFLGMYLFGNFFGPIRMLSWPNLLSYFIWISIIVSCVAVLDVTASRLVLTLLISSKSAISKWIVFVVLLGLPVFFFVIATALVSGTSINSIVIAQGSFDGYWSVDFILDRFSLLANNPFADIGNIQILSIRRPVRTQALTWFAGIGSLSVFAFAIISIFSTRIANATTSWRFFKLEFIRTHQVSKFLWRYLFGIAFILFAAGLFFALEGL